MPFSLTQMWCHFSGKLLQHFCLVIVTETPWNLIKHFLCKLNRTAHKKYYYKYYSNMLIMYPFDSICILYIDIMNLFFKNLIGETIYVILSICNNKPSCNWLFKRKTWMFCVFGSRRRLEDLVHMSCMHVRVFVHNLFRFIHYKINTVSHIWFYFWFIKSN